MYGQFLNEDGYIQKRWEALAKDNNIGPAKLERCLKRGNVRNPSCTVVSACTFSLALSLSLSLPLSLSLSLLLSLSLWTYLLDVASGPAEFLLPRFACKQAENH